MSSLWRLSVLVLAAALLASRVFAAEPEANAGKQGAAAECVGPDCVTARPSRQASEAMELARAALDKVVATYQVDRGKIRDLVRGSQGFAVLQDLVKTGFIFAQIHGHGFLVYRQPDGRWGPPLMLEVWGSSIGPQIGSRISDVLVVFKDAESIQQLLKGQMPHGLITPSGSVLYGSTESTSQSPGIVTYSLHRGIMLGQSADEYRLLISEQDNLSLYGEPLKSGEIVDVKRIGMHIPAPVAMFVDHINAQLGEPAQATQWKVDAPAPRP
jgi:lipid-binding SYLF domain-containing protein